MMTSLVKWRRISFASRVICAALLGTLPTLAPATNDIMVDAHVTVVEASYIPWALYFIIDQSPTNCPSGSWMRWNIGGSDEPSRIANAQAVISTLVTAKVSGKTVRLFGNSVDCSVDYIWLTN
jgi:hypothetical protein